MARVLATTATAVILSPTIASAFPTPPEWWLKDAHCIAWYESSNETHNQQNPSYRGLYQIGWSQWRSVGGQGDPADASWGEQTWRAYLLWLRYGWGPWETAPLCGL